MIGDSVNNNGKIWNEKACYYKKKWGEGHYYIFGTIDYIP